MKTVAENAVLREALTVAEGRLAHLMALRV